MRLKKIRTNKKSQQILIDDTFMQQNYIIFDQTIVDNERWYSVQVSDTVRYWIRDTFIENIDYIEINFLKGIWIDMSEEVFILLKLKW